MKLEEAKERLLELSKVSEKGAKLHPDDAELFLTDKEALETVIAELHAMQNLLDEKNEEIEHLQKEKVSKEKLVEAIDFAINATDSDDNYSIGLCNGMIYVKSLITDGNPDYKKCKNNSISKDEIRKKIKQMKTEEKIKTKNLGGTDRYLVKLEYMHKENALQELLKEE